MTLVIIIVIDSHPEKKVHDRIFFFDHHIRVLIRMSAISDRQRYPDLYDLTPSANYH